MIVSINEVYYTFVKRYYVFHPTTRFVCLSVCVSVCVCLCVCESVIRIVTRWLDLVTQYYMTLLPLTTAQKCNIVKMIRWQDPDHMDHLYKISHFGLQLQNL